MNKKLIVVLFLSLLNTPPHETHASKKRILLNEQQFIIIDGVFISHANVHLKDNKNNNNYNQDINIIL